MLSLLRRFSALGAVIAFIRSPMGQEMLHTAGGFVSNPDNRAKAGELVGKIRRQPTRPQR